MSGHAEEPWEENTSFPPFTTNWPEALGYLDLDDKKRAIECVNEFAGIDDVGLFMGIIRKMFNSTCENKKAILFKQALALLPHQTAKEETNE